MNRIYNLVLLLFISSNLFSQAPAKMTYQAVIRDSSNKIVSGMPVKMRISILQGNASGTSVYTESHNPTTSINGLIVVEIGGGASQVGNLSSIDWSKGPYFLKTETDPSNGSNFTITGTTQFLSVPFSLYSANAGYRANGNTALGFQSMSSNSSGNPNTAYGFGSLKSNTTGFYNTAIGFQALQSNTTGVDNEAIGNNAMRDNTTGSSNTALGGNALLQNIDGVHNVAIGHAVNEQNKSGRFNTMVGSFVAENLATGENNTMIGYGIASSWNSGSGNVLIGSNVGNNNVNKDLNNKLIISNNSTSTPLVYGDFSNRTIKFNHFIDSPIVYNILSFQDANANSHINKYENNLGEPLIYARYMYGQYGDLIIQGLSRTYTGNIHFVTGSTVPGADPPTQRMVVMNNGKVGIGNFINNAPRSRLEIREGDVYLPNSTNGIILTSANGSCWRVTVDDNGNLIRTKISCPTN